MDTEAVLSPGHQIEAADWLDSPGVTWTHGWGDGTTTGCAHTALLRPCATPGDEVMWSAWERHYRERLATAR